MQNKQNYTEKLIEIAERLPDFCQSFLLETQTERSSSTRLAYARDLELFFDYLISYHPHFAEKSKNDLLITDLKMITAIDINRFISKYAEKHAETTVARKRASLSSFFAYFCGIRQLDYNPISGATKVKIHENENLVYLNNEEQKKIVATVTHGTGLDKNKAIYHDRYQKRDTALLSLLLDTGMRVSELHGIDIKDLDLEECSVIVLRKGGKIEKVYFSDYVCNLISDYLEEKQDKFRFNGSEEPLFTTLQGNRLSVRAIEVLIKKYAKASLPSKANKLSPHKMRSTFAMDLYGATYDLLLVQKRMGHKNITATNIYAKATDKQVAESRNIIQENKSSIKQQNK